MNFTYKVKNEIINEKQTNNCCKLALLSAYLRTAGTIEIQNGKVGFSLLGEQETNNYVDQIIESLYGVKPMVLPEFKGDRSKSLYINEKSLQILQDAEMVRVAKGGLDLVMSISNKLIKKRCCKRAYIIGAFLGSGSITVPKMKSEKATGYHVEFVFSKYLSAQDFCYILSDNGLIAKLIERKDSYVVYSKSSEEICDLLVTMGAKHAFLELQDIIVKKMVKNNTNRIINCEMSNLNKQIDASYKQRNDIQTIIDVLGLDSLPLPLQQVAKARLDYPDDSLSALSEKLNITKSCLSHRLKRLSEIADSL